MGSGFSKMKKQAKEMQKQMAEMKEKLEKVEVEGSSGGGMVTITLNGDKQLKKIQIQPDCVDPKDIEGLEDLILAAFEDAARKVEQENPTSGLSQMPFGL